ncbi:UDP-glucose 4-epimerase GalE [Halomonas litopenaei]|uniref:UDP-glucose 4-epimerase GalE n=1 Tax=Halomonas litopenaei TaxID=2109328 RepID=UPI001A8E89BF|nr:UDP-glucose 4-epimerase GalE [Halomonas litopenaei]MBN8413399.1 UDP-glucose 4-epimerase GalE [Halomonas litopenaei]
MTTEHSSKARVLVVGGAGYIGSHMVKRLRRSGYAVTVLDNLSRGHRDAVMDAELMVGDLGDSALLDRLLASQAFDVVMHFAALIEVGESVRDPAAFYHNNVMKSLVLLDAMVRHDISRLVFSSTAAVYGVPGEGDLDESRDCNPINPYGNTKHLVERALEDYRLAYGMRSICLRYFNAAGADPEGVLGERHDPETHLIPLVLQAASGRRSQIQVFGDDYPTADGSCIRDFVHVEDLCRAHELALERLLAGGSSETFNLGCGVGYSVFELIRTAEEVSGRKIETSICPRRPGDPARLVASICKAQEVLGWAPTYDLRDILTHAWLFENRHFLGHPP